MAFGKSLELRYMSWAQPKARETVKRDRSLRGKARVKARKLANKAF